MVTTIFMSMSPEELKQIFIAFWGGVFLLAIILYAVLGISNMKDKTQPVVSMKSKIVEKNPAGIGNVFIFECEDGERRMFYVKDGMYIVGDKGNLTFQGKSFINFRKEK